MVITELKPGVETDRLIAEALDVFVEMATRPIFHAAYNDQSGEDPVIVMARGRGAGTTGDGIWPFYPSTDLNDAIWAADQVGLFNLPCDPYGIVKCDDVWLIYDVMADHSNNQISSSKTLAMAICKAILGLSYQILRTKERTERLLVRDGRTGHTDVETFEVLHESDEIFNVEQIIVNSYLRKHIEWIDEQIGIDVET